MKRVSDFPLINALVIEAKTTSLPPATVDQCREIMRHEIPKYMVSQFRATETYLAARTTLAQIPTFYKSILDGDISLPKEHENTMRYAAYRGHITKSLK